jgi:hypothetical protein
MDEGDRNAPTPLSEGGAVKIGVIGVGERAACIGTRRRDLLQRSAAYVVVASTGGLFIAETSQGAAVARDGPSGGNGRKDFDFFLGDWNVSAKRLRHRLTGDKTWDVVTGTTRVHAILQGAGNVDEDESLARREIHRGNAQVV